MKTCPLCETTYPSHHTNCPTDGAILIETRELEQGTLIRGKYRIMRQLGRGGMGTVYLAEHIMLSRLRALKFISSELSQDVAFLRRFRREAQAAIELRHPNIVEVVDLDQAEDGSPYIAMEYVEGPDLRHELAHGVLPVERALAIARGIALGLGAAHAKGIIHRDVKPENILLTGKDGAPETPKLLDFGIAAMKEGATTTSRTHGLMLTPPYASPEQWKGMAAEELDGRADLYALGGVLYEMLTGQTPFHAHNTEGWMHQHLFADPQPPSQLRPELRNFPGLDALVLRTLEREREQRFDSAATLAEALAEVLSPQPSAQATPAYQPTPTYFEPSRTPRPAITSRPIPTPAPVELPAYRSDSLHPAAPKPRSSKLQWIAAAAVVVVGLGIWLATGFAGSRPTTEAPKFSLAGGTYPEGHAVGLSDPTPNATIHYTTDGSKPTEASPTYLLPIWPLSSGATVRAVATAEGHAPSSEVSSTYIWTAAAPSSARPPESATAAGSVAPATVSLYNQGKSAYDHKQFGPARTFFTQACDGGNGNMSACNYLGYLYAQGLGGPINELNAKEFWQKACDHNIFASCAGLGRLYQDSGDNDEARKYIEKACKGGVAGACKALNGAQ
jgi:serine/threonine-protein kinase